MRERISPRLNIEDDIMNLTNEELELQMSQLSALLEERLWESVELNESLTESISIEIENSTNSLEITWEWLRNIEITTTRITNRMTTILDSDSYLDMIIKIIWKMQEIPFIQKIILSGGLILTIWIGVLILIKYIRKIKNPQTIVTPFGPRITPFGRIMRVLMYKE